MNAGMLEILIVDDHAIVRKGVRLMLADAPGMTVAGEADSTRQALALANERHFDVALVDIALPDRNGLELLQLLRLRHPKIAVLMLSTYSEDIYAMRAIRLGAAGYLTKDVPEETLVAAIRKAAAGGRYLSPLLVDKLVGNLGNVPSPSPAHETLSNRELQVLRLIASGDSLVSIAEQLHLSPNTVTTYRTRILEKMQLKSNADLTRYAIESGLLM